MSVVTVRPNSQLLSCMNNEYSFSGVCIGILYELCRRTQQPSLTFCLVGGSTFGLWPLFHLRDGGKWTEMTATEHWGYFKTLFLDYITIKIMLVFFIYWFFL
jgi:hypothetical protein